MSMAVLTFLVAVSMLAYASDDHLCQDGGCNATVTTQGTSLLMRQKQLGKTQLAKPSKGDLSCPCLTKAQLDITKGGTFPEKIYEKKVDGMVVKTLKECDDHSKDIEWIFPEFLGIDECQNMESLAPFCGKGGEPRRWKSGWMCAQQFCHVDPDHCPKDWLIPGNLFPGLAFSYQTCLSPSASKEEKERVTKITKLLKEDHRAYHCAAAAVDEQLQNDAEKVED